MPKSNVQYKEWYQSDWPALLGLEPTIFASTINALLKTSFGDTPTSLLKSVSANVSSAEYVVRLPGTKPVVRFVPRRDSFTMQVGTDYVGGVLQNAITLQNHRGGYDMGVWMTQRTGMFAAPTGVMFASAVDTISATYWQGSNHGFAAVLKEDGSGIDPDRLLIWTGSWGAQSAYNNYAQGNAVSVSLYDWPTNTIINRVTVNFPVMYMSNFGKALDAGNGKIYGVKCYTPFAPYLEVPFFRVMGSDTVTPGMSTEADRPYLTLDPLNVQAHAALMHAYPGALPLGSNGRLAVHWVP